MWQYGKFKHHMRLNFLNSVCARWIEKKHSLLQLRHEVSCQPVNQSPCACWLPHSFVHRHLLICTVFIQHHIALSRKRLKRLSDENGRKGKAKMVSKVSEPINHKDYHIMIYQNGTTLSCRIQYIGFRSWRYHLMKQTSGLPHHHVSEWNYIVLYDA